MTDPYPASDFDAWAESYDRDVLVEDFPLTGYEQALATVVRLAQAGPAMRVLDLGAGTGNLALRFAALGCELWCTDFSPAMLELARHKLPRAVFAVHDLRQPEWPAGFDGLFDRIVSAYVFHHFVLNEKIRIVQALEQRLAPGGWLVIADIAFASLADMESARQVLGDAWEQEEYWLADEACAAMQAAGLEARYVPVSYCAGVFRIAGKSV